MNKIRRLTKKQKRYVFLALVIAITLLGGALRARGVRMIPSDYDEWIYLDASQNYAQYLEKLDIKNIVYLNENYEHPPLAKLVYALALVGIPRQPVTYAALMTDPVEPAVVANMQYRARIISTVLGTLAVLLLSFVNPLAAFFLAIQTIVIHFTSVVYLEALPAVTSLGAILAYDRWQKSTSAHEREKSKWSPATSAWLGLSAIGLGLSIASKYMYAVVGIAIIVHFSVKYLLRGENRGSHFLMLIGWATLALAVFFIADPYLWVKTGARLLKTLSFHFDYSQSTHVVESEYPAWQPLLWLLSPVPDLPSKAISYQPGSFLFKLDLPIAILALAGLPALLKRRTIYAVWLGVGLVMLLLWSTKWPQYVMIIAIPWCLSAAEGLMSIGWLVWQTIQKINRFPWTI